MIPKTEILKNISQAISESSIPQNELAELLGVTPKQLANFKTGKTLPTLRVLSRLCTVLHLDANEILCLNKKA